MYRAGNEFTAKGPLVSFEAFQYSSIISKLMQSFTDLSNKIINSSRGSSELSWLWTNHLYELWDILLWYLTEAIQGFHASEEVLFWWIAVEILQQCHCQLHSYIIEYLCSTDITPIRLVELFDRQTPRHSAGLKFVYLYILDWNNATTIDLNHEYKREHSECKISAL